jgi:hypothetical protein
VVSDDRRDWIDEVMASGGTWNPPVDFAERVVARAVAVDAVPAARLRRAPAFDAAGFAQYVRTRVLDHVLGRLEASAWVMRQYSDLLLR